ncbi:MAG: hypothetical protein KBD03_01425 [Gammaproteobacteria bacterium]|nr:hypothetical protein [Gammaproteobacteria bacterium]
MMPEVEADKTLEKEQEAVSPINPLELSLDLSDIEESKTDLAYREFRLFEEHKKLYDDISNNIAQLLEMRNGYLLEDIIDLNIFQLRALMCGYKLKQVKNPIWIEFWIALFEKFGKRFGSIVDKLVKTDLRLTEVADLTPLQLCGLEKECLGLGLAEVRHPRFCQSVILAMEAGYSFETVINLEPWQHQALAVGLPLKKVRNLNPEFTLRHLEALKLGGAHCYDDVAGLDRVSLEDWFATPCLCLREVQQSLESVEIKDDVFRSFVSVNANSRESVSSTQRSCSSTSYYHSGISSSSLSSRSSSSSSSSSSRSSSIPTLGSILTQYREHQPQTSWPSSFVDDPEFFHWDEKNSECRRLPGQPH